MASSHGGVVLLLLQRHMLSMMGSMIPRVRGAREHVGKCRERFTDGSSSPVRHADRRRARVPARGATERNIARAAEPQQHEYHLLGSPSQRVKCERSQKRKLTAVRSPPK